MITLPPLRSRIFRFKRLHAVILLSLFFLRPASVLAGFSVSPLTIEFDKKVKSALISIEAQGPENVNLQMRAVLWTQDADGKDVYTDTSDLIYLPKLMTVKGNKSRALRVGTTQSTIVDKEKCYRLFIEEIPAPRKDAEGPNVNISFRFALPVYIKPVKEIYDLKIEKAEMSGKGVIVLVRNSGNAHQRVFTVDIRGKDSGGNALMSARLNGWYVLGGSSSKYFAEIPKDRCNELKTIEVEVNTDRGPIKQDIAIDAAKCQP
ncbi:MAG: molecular chaperone [Deltaproteobacteria bacterium]|nr:molecular chaperone [Deltaproteobacteria bacterium]